MTILSKYRGIVIVTSLLLISPCLCCGSYRLVSHIKALVLWHSTTAPAYQISLTPLGIGPSAPYLNYTDTVITVTNARVVRVCVKNGQPMSSKIEDYQRYTVEGLFDAASRFVIDPLQKSQYDTTYGIPSQISSGFMEFGGFSITNFRVLSKAEVNSLPPSDFTCI